MTLILKFTNILWVAFKNKNWYSFAKKYFQKFHQDDINFGYFIVKIKINFFFKIS